MTQNGLPIQKNIPAAAIVGARIQSQSQAQNVYLPSVLLPNAQSTQHVQTTNNHSKKALAVDRGRTRQTNPDQASALQHRTSLPKAATKGPNLGDEDLSQESQEKPHCVPDSKTFDTGLSLGLVAPGNEIPKLTVQETVELEDLEYLVTNSEFLFALQLCNVKGCEQCQALNNVEAQGGVQNETHIETTDVKTSQNQKQTTETKSKEQEGNPGKATNKPSKQDQLDHEEEEEEEEAQDEDDEDEAGYEVYDNLDASTSAVKSRKRKKKCDLRDVPSHIQQLWREQKGLCKSCRHEPLTLYQSGALRASDFRFRLKRSDQCPTPANIAHLICVPCRNLLQSCMYREGTFNQMRDVMFAEYKVKQVFHMFHIPSETSFLQLEQQSSGKENKIRIRLTGVPIAHLRSLWSNQGGLSSYKLSMEVLQEMHEEWRDFFTAQITAYDEKKMQEQEEVTVKSQTKVKGRLKRNRYPASQDPNSSNNKRARLPLALGNKVITPSFRAAKENDKKQEVKNPALKGSLQTNKKPLFWDDPHYLVFQVPLYVGSMSSLFTVQPFPKIARRQPFSPDYTTLVARVLSSMQGQLSIGEFICWAFRRIKMAPLIMDRGKRFPRVEPLFRSLFRKKNTTGKASSTTSTSTSTSTDMDEKQQAMMLELEKKTQKYANLEVTSKYFRQLARNMSRTAKQKYWENASEYLFLLAEEQNCKSKDFFLDADPSNDEGEDPLHKKTGGQEGEKEKQEEEPASGRIPKRVGLSLGMRNGRPRKIDKEFMKESLPLLLSNEVELGMNGEELQELIDKMVEKLWSPEFRRTYPPSHQIYIKQLKEE